MTCLKKTALLAAVVAFPSVAIAGGYGSAGVKDATVGQSPTQTATIWCPKLKTEVPVALSQQMDCGNGVAVGTAQPAVARERFGGRGLFGLPAHQPSGPRSALDGSDGPVANNTPKTPPNGNPPTGTDDDEPERPTDEPTDEGSTSKSKWERLAEFGVRPDNYNEQPDEFRSAIRDYVEQNGGYEGDWSDFDPTGGSTDQ